MATVIRQKDLIESVADALQFISYYHPLDFIQALNDAYEREANPAAKDAMAQILINSRMCAEGHRPICQDTGIVTVFLNVGMDVQWQGDMSVTDMVNEGVRRAYMDPDNKLRASILEDPDGTRKNTGDNTPCVIHYQLVPGDKLEVHVAAKGGGSEAKTKFAMLNPSDSLVDWVLKMVPTMGAGWCPPGMLGIGIGGTTTVVADGDDLLLTSGFSNALQVLDPVTGAVSLDIRDLVGVTNAIRHDGDIVAAQIGSQDPFVPASVVEAEGVRDVLLDGTMTGGVPFFVPLGLASDGDRLYVGDWATGIVWAVHDGTASILAAELAFPEGMTVDGDRLLVVETGRQQVTAINLATGDKSAVIVGLDYSDRVPEGFFPFGIMSGVAVGERSIYVSDDGVNKVYEFRRRR